VVFLLSVSLSDGLDALKVVHLIVWARVIGGRRLETWRAGPDWAWRAGLRTEYESWSFLDLVVSLAVADGVHFRV
jgi:hypothetical protein